MNGYRAHLLLWLVAACAVVSACSGGGSSSTPVPVASLAGQGSTEPLDQKITLRIEVPAEVPGLIPSAAAARARVRALRRSAVATPPPYLSPKTGSIELALAAIGGQSFAQVPPPIPPIEIPSGCQGSATGCVFTAANIIAAKGVNTYFVTTYTGPNATGNIISTGFIDVTAPASSVATFGGAAGALSIGGYVGSLALAPQRLTFTQGTPGSHGVLVQAFDPAGAAIVGSSQYVNPIVVTVGDSVNFNFGGAGAQLSLAQPITTPLPLRYLGSTSLAGGTLVTASTTDENNAPASAAPLVVAVTTPTPCAAGCPTGPPSPYSIYVDLTDIDTIQEYALGAAIAAGNAPTPSPNGTVPPRRSITFVPPSGGNVSCQTIAASPQGTGNGTNGIAISSAGTIVVAPYCTDGLNLFLYGYPATAVGSSPPSLRFGVLTSTLGTIGNFNALATDDARGLVFAFDPDEYAGTLVGWPNAASSTAPSVVLGSTCIVEIGYPNCNYNQNTANSNPGAFANTFAGFGIDSAADIYDPTFYQDPTSCDRQSFANCPAIAIVKASGASAVTSAYSAIAGNLTELGGPNVTPLSATVDGNLLYVLASAAGNDNPDGSYPGLSSCGPTLDSLILACADGSSHNYLVGYQIGPSIVGSSAAGTNVNLQPLFVLGGDLSNRFGCAYDTANSGEYLAARNGYVYVLNDQPTCPDQSQQAAPEIDVYNTNGLSGPTIAKALVYVIPFASTTNWPAAIAVGPVGPAGAVGGAFERRAKPRPFRPYLHNLPLRRARLPLHYDARH